MVSYHLYLCDELKLKIMTTLNTANALLTAKEILTQMISQGLADAKFTFVLSKVISEKFNLNEKQSIIIIEEALKLA